MVSEQIRKLREFVRIAGSATAVEQLALDLADKVEQLEAKNEKLMGELMSLKAAYYRANNRRWQAEEERDALKATADEPQDERS